MPNFFQRVSLQPADAAEAARVYATVVATLALGIGANATIFTWIKAVPLAPLPGVERPDELVEVLGSTRNNSALSLSYLDYLDLRDRNDALAGLAPIGCSA